ncbi:zinc-binding alcohol dehydrogenase family protein [Rhizobium sp. PP-F2F-G38]|uniref:Zinc-type alcohol dehydrogenase-like protein n=1 Tax=Ferranicluibacter rubi TaxID=2715133 RepID=A0AA43ZE67_9HYPH|nr:zinc-binding alcohol dehydrogenase family protein [Ferranicluibacter rubi]NHT75476.1 zinc-binding alcohol dehydrogenase family protein [Ferranicluibacter rubi]PYE33977.1 zinc-binding alcohol dehydrogenase family protein [Rhizobium sp. PP-WC-1G-195]PYE94500.1 zinc-binding alcohol dehydrogenase family protein [Rhizobium sp. PP-F2F-G38]TCP80337.1 zinc-binding alcohol dehydrogenase family protein [Rhizobium sp. PP-CC-2G-626]
MKAVAYTKAGTIERDDALIDVEISKPTPGPRDLLVAVDAISVNPVDTKIRKNVSPEAGAHKVLGWDAVGRVVEVGAAVAGFKPGDAVYYAGSLLRPGANSEFHLVDERLVGRKPSSLSNAEAAALPLTAITAWEMLFDRLDVRKPVAGAADAILIIGGAGGVGSIAIQLVRALTGLTVIATASRPETRDWVRELGAHHVIDHSKPLADQITALGIGAPAFVFSTTETHRHLAEIISLIAPQGRFGLIDDPESLDVTGFKRKAVSIHWELMFTRSIFETPDMDEQGKLLTEVAALIDAGKIRTTVTEVLRPINAKNLKQAHAVIESGKARGKIVLEGF